MTIHARIKADGSHAVVELNNVGVYNIGPDGANLTEDDGGTAWFVWDDFELVTMPDEEMPDLLLVDRQLHGTPHAPEGPDDPGWFALLEKAKDNGLEYANNGIAAGETAPQESPLSGEWAGAITPRDVVNMAAGRDDAYDSAKDFEIDDLCNSWEDGYNSAPWPDQAPS